MEYTSCPECGARLASGADHCDLCGAPLEVKNGGGEAAPAGSRVPGDRSATDDSALDDDIPEPSTPSAMDADELQCSACGFENVPGSNFCSRCGARLGRGADDASGEASDTSSRANTPSDVGLSSGAAQLSDAGQSSDVGQSSDKGQSSGAGQSPDAGQSSNVAQSKAAAPPATSGASASEESPSKRSMPATPERGAPPPATGTNSPDEPEGEGNLTRHVGMLIGLAVLVVVALFMITVISKQRGAMNPESAVNAPVEARSASIIREREAVPVDEAYRGRVDSLSAVISDADAEASVAPRRQLVDVLLGIGRIDRAAIEQQRVARITDAAPDWKKAANLLFDWMETTEPDSRPRVALLAIDAYKQLLQQEPDDLDARADLGWVYQYDPQNPMEAIRHTNMVLEERPDHVPANYNRGVFLMRINRLDDALEQFERVKAIAGAESPYYVQANMWIETIRESGTQDARG